MLWPHQRPCTNLGVYFPDLKPQITWNPWFYLSASQILVEKINGTLPGKLGSGFLESNLPARANHHPGAGAHQLCRAGEPDTHASAGDDDGKSAEGRPIQVELRSLPTIQTGAGTEAAAAR